VGTRFLKEGATRSKYSKKFDVNLQKLALTVALQDGEPELLDRAIDIFTKADTPLVRKHLLNAFGRVTEPAKTRKVLALVLDEKLRSSEVYELLDLQMEIRTNQAATWNWLTLNFNGVLKRVSGETGGEFPWLTYRMCSEGEAAQVKAFFSEHIQSLPGGQRNLVQALEYIDLCAARVERYRKETSEFFNFGKASEVESRAKNPTSDLR
jgi:alanyl aminopeptidase